MSVQFGRWNLDSRPVEPAYLERVKSIVNPYAPDCQGSYARDGIGILYHAFHTTEESHQETQPHITARGSVITWDGRLDNREELLAHVGGVPSSDATDVEIVGAAYEQWDTSCLARLVGDWALTIWDATNRTLLLAKDCIGVRSLYYSVDKEQITWCTILDPLILLGGKTTVLNEEYVAGWLSFFPATDLTPFTGTHSVRPSSFVKLCAKTQTIRDYWHFDPRKTIRYASDRDYEEHFRTVLTQAVRRRLRSDRPILAELSGGMDSSSIVCLADRITADAPTTSPRIDTISYYNESEPNWNERPFFTLVEHQRGRTGCHIDLSCQSMLPMQYDQSHFYATPGSGGPFPHSGEQFVACLRQDHRVVLSGIGGDEVLGGVPTPIPELAQLIATGQFGTLFRQVIAWARVKRQPLLYLLAETMRVFLPLWLVGVPKNKQPAGWLAPAFAKRYQHALQGYETRVKIFGPSPVSQENAATLDVLRRQLACFALAASPVYETRYPYLDRDLLAFLYSIPREQLLRPLQRRSLMRRAMLGIVPDEILNRRRKAFVSKSPLIAKSDQWILTLALTANMLTSSLGFLKTDSLIGSMQRAREGHAINITVLARTFALEYWLRHLQIMGFLPGVGITNVAKEIQSQRG